VGDKGYSYPLVRRLLRRRRIRGVIPRRKDQRPVDQRHSFDRAAYRERNKVERLVNALKQYRRLATRYDKRAVYYLAMLTLACALLWLSPVRRAHRYGCDPTMVANRRLSRLHRRR
jgi:transposase